jgi:hypothetical protein
MIRSLIESSDPLALEFKRAQNLQSAAAQLARRIKNFSRLARGKLNIYKLFVAQADTLIRRSGIFGVLCPSGIASDQSSSEFFKHVASKGRVICLFDFENRRGNGQES